MTLALVGTFTEVALWPTRVTSAAPPVETPLDGIGIIEDPTDPPPVPADPVGPILFGDFDANGDGVNDFILARDADAQFNRSRLGVISGATGQLLFKILAQNEGDMIGFPIATGAGDINNDGYDDILATVMSADADNPESASISVHVYSGLNGAELRSHTGSGAEGFGMSVAPAGDADGDSYDDYLIGIPFAHTADLINNGRVLLISGRTGATIHIVDGLEGGEAFGTSLAGLGDVDGDGCADFAIGAPGASDSYAQTIGHVRIYSGRTGQLIRDISGLVGTKFGASISSSRDLDQDGLADLLIAAPHHVHPDGDRSGRVIAVSPSSSEIIFELYGDPGYHFGITVQGSSLDADNDGQSDILISSMPSNPVGDFANATFAFAYYDKVPSLRSFTLADLAADAVESTSQSVRADTNNDGVVDSLDLIAVLAEFGDPNASSNTDINIDGVTDTLDLIEIMQRIGGPPVAELRLPGINLCLTAIGITGTTGVLVSLGCAHVCLAVVLCPFCATYGYGVVAAEALVTVATCLLDFAI